MKNITRNFNNAIISTDITAIILFSLPHFMLLNPYEQVLYIIWNVVTIFLYQCHLEWPCQVFFFFWPYFVELYFIGMYVCNLKYPLISHDHYEHHTEITYWLHIILFWILQALQAMIMQTLFLLFNRVKHIIIDVQR